MKKFACTDKGALSLILYPYQFGGGPAFMDWNDSELRRLEKMFDMDRLLYIEKNIANYFERKDVDLNEVLPSARMSVEEKEAVLKSICEGIQAIAKKNIN